MSPKTEAVRNVGSTWFSLLVHLAVGFFLSPFILHKLGDTAFGLWVLVFSLTGYFGVFDFGIRSSLVRYVAKFTAAHDQDQLTLFVNTSLSANCAIALFVLLLTVIGALHLNNLFRIPPDLIRTGQWLFLMVGAQVALTFPLSVFSGIIEGLQKFSWLNATQIMFSLLRGFLIVIALDKGRGLLTIALITVMLNLLIYASLVAKVFKTIPLQLGVRFVNLTVLREMMSYGVSAFLIIIGEKLCFQSGPAVVGMFVSSAAITYFAVGLKLVEYSTSPVQGLTQILAPMCSHFDATGDMDRLRQICITGSQACATLIFPACAALIVLGKPIIQIWMGSEYISSYIVLLFLILPKTLYLVEAASCKVLLGMGKHGMLGVVILIDGISSLFLSALLVRHFGIAGVALGTALPLISTSLFFLPRHICRLLKVPLAMFLMRAYLLPLILCAPFVAILVCLRHLFYPHNYLQLFTQLALAGLVYIVCLLAWYLTKEPAGIELRAKFLLSR